MKRLFASDIVTIIYIGILTLLVILHTIDWQWYIMFHALAVALILLVHYAYSNHPSGFWRLVKHWLIIILILSAYREIFYLVPAIRGGVLYDEELAAIDQSVFGYNFMLHNIIGNMILSDLLSFCYWMYFPMPVILGIVLYSKGMFRDFRMATCGLVFAWFVSYIGYIIVPAMGPYWIEQRPEILNGFYLGSIMHNDVMLNIQWGASDAFPSGHTLITIITLYYCFKFHRLTFGLLLPIGIGLIIGTIYLRYHYVVDVAVSFLLAPLLLWLSNRFFAWWDSMGSWSEVHLPK